MVYGGGSIKRTGLYHTILDLLQDFEIYELSGIEPNPKLSSVREGVRICKEKDIDVILAVGGGSCIDAAKHISCAAHYPKLSICDPQYLYTLPKSQTAAGTVDIISHVFEQYFQPNDEAYITDRLSEAVLKTCFKYGPIAMKEPDNYEARSNLMWASTIGLNHLLTVGKGGAWSVHPIEHELSAFYDLTHGVGLAILTPAWMRYVLCDKTVNRFAMYAENVWGIWAEDPYEAARAAIDRTESFFNELCLPGRLSEVGIGPERFEEMAVEAVRTSGVSSRSYFPLEKEDIVRIFESCM